MTDERGLSVGAANLTAVAVGRAAVRRTAVLTAYAHRPSEVGVPSENPGLDARGLVITDFVDRVGDPVALLASDGSPHRAEALLADALRAMLPTIERAPSNDAVGIAHPAYWRPAAVDALRGALAATPGFRAPRPVRLTSDATAVLTALQQDPGVPSRGVIALCDVGASGTSITLADAAGLRPIAPTARHLDFSGDAVDQALLRHVMTGMTGPESAELTGTSAIGSLSRLRAQCRTAKERLSTASVTALPGERGEIRLTRRELDEAIREPLDVMLAELQDTLQRNGVRAGQLAAIAIAGGGARIPLITTMLSERFRVPVVAGPHPDLAAAIGAGLSAARGTVVEVATSLAPAAGVVAAASAPTGLAPAAVAAAAPSGGSSGLAWSVDDDAIPDVMPGPDYEPEADAWSGDEARPQLEFAEHEPTPERESPPWYRNPFVLVAGGIAIALAAIGVAIVTLLDAEDDPGPTAPTTTTATSSPAPAAPPAETSAPPTAAETAPRRERVAPSQPPPVTVTEQAPPSQAPTTETAPPTTEAPPQTTEAPPTTTQAPSTTTQPPSSTQPPVIPTLPYQTIPGLPFVPSPFQPQQR